MSRLSQWLFRGARRSRPLAFRPRFESLENREVPATLTLLADGTVNYVAKSGVANDLTVTVGEFGYRITDSENIKVDTPGQLFNFNIVQNEPNSVRIFASAVSKLNFSLGDRNDRANILGTVDPLVVDMGAGDDIAFVGRSDIGLGEIHAPVKIGGGTNALEIDRLVVADASESTVGRKYEIRPNQIDFVSSKVVHSGVELIRIEAGQGADRFNVLGTAVRTQTRLEGSGGSDAFIVGDAAAGLNNLQGTVALSGGVQSFLDSNTLIVDDLTAIGRTYTVQRDSIQRSGAARILMPDADFSSTTLNASNGADNINVVSTNGNKTLNINADGGNDTILLQMTGVAEGSRMNFDGGSSTSLLADKFIIDDANTTPTGRSYSIEADRVFFTLSNNIGAHLPTSANYSGLEQVTLNAGKGADLIRVARMPVFHSVVVNAGDGNDIIRFSLPDTVGFFGTVTVNGGNGSDWLDYSGNEFGVNVDLAAGTATGARGGITSIENVLGSEFGDVLAGNAANNILVGKSGTDTLNGRDGRDVLIGGSGADSLFGGSGEDVLCGDNLDGQDSPATMQEIMDVWSTRAVFQLREAFLQNLINSSTQHSDGANDSLSGGPDADFVLHDLTV